MFTPATAVSLDPSQKRALESLARAGTTPQSVREGARSSCSPPRGCQQLHCAEDRPVPPHCDRSTGGVWARRRGGTPAAAEAQTLTAVLTPELQQKILDTTLKTRPPDATHWSVRTLAARLGVTRTLVHGVWQRFDVQPHRVERFKLSMIRDSKRRCGCGGLYLDPPDRL